ncbi:MAG: hypothetical protein IPI46_03005 [Bacteroidetes bacterium]|nr:hypothetical protein [Bacteroidota bacterium]
MKKIIILSSIFCLLFQLDGNCCKRKKKRKAAQTTIQSKPITQNLVVSFISFGSGIDYKSIPGFEQLIEGFNLKNGCKMSFTKKNWGREGEVDYCFTANSAECLQQFTDAIKSNYSKNERILIKENGKCKN